MSWRVMHIRGDVPRVFRTNMVVTTLHDVVAICARCTTDGAVRLLSAGALPFIGHRSMTCAQALSRRRPI
jgi:hypothetical protein